MKIFNGLIKVIISLFLFINTCSSSFAHELKLGMGGAPGKNQKGIALNLEYVAKPFEVLKNDVHPLIGISKNMNGYISFVYTGLVLKKYLENNLLVEISLGAAIHDGPLKNNKKHKKRMRTLGSRLLFHEHIAFGYIFSNGNNVTLFIEHISNANLAKPNSGVSNAGIKYGFQI